MRNGPIRSLWVVGLLTAGLWGAAVAPDAGSVPRWAPAATATIHPGVQMVTAGQQCTSNFVFTRGTEVFLGYAAHCAGTGTPTDTNGCTTKSLPLGTAVTIQGATRPGRLAYSSWRTMQLARERNADACAHNDFALVKIDPADVRRVNPSIPHWGGPTGLGTGPIPSGASVYSYGSSSLRLGLGVLSPKTGFSLGTDASGWSHPVYTVTPGIPGDSGSALLDGRGRAAGVLSTVILYPRAGSNDFTSLAHAIYYAGARGRFGVTLAKGTVAFTPGKAPVGSL